MAVVTRDELLARQERVIHALAADGALSGIDPSRVDLVRTLARTKRIAKIESVLPRTCRALGGEFPRLSAEFVHAMAPTSFRSRADGLAFYRFLGRRRADPALLDLAYCELALSALRTPSSRKAPVREGGTPGTVVIRRAPSVRLRVRQFDVRAFFEDAAAEVPAALQRSPVHLAFVPDPPAGTPRITQLSPGLFEFLRALRVWRPLPDATDQDGRRLLEDLEQRGLLEIAGA
jgi:hypothetical protein